MKTKILLIGINARYTHSNLAIRYLRNSIQNLNFETQIVEYSINQNSLDILQDIYFRKPDIIAFSVYIWNSELIKILLPEIKKILAECKLILGGPEVSFNSQEWLKNFPQIDYIITGYGEAGFRFLAENDFESDQKIISKLNQHFNQIPFPYLEEDFPEMEHKYIYYESSRGCSFKCSYCLSSRSDQKLEFRSLEQVKTELNWLLERNPKIIKFVDRTFNIKPDFSKVIWKFLIEKDTNAKFHFEIHPELLQNEDFEILEKCPADRFQFEIGIQSTNSKTLEAIHRKQNWEKIKSNIGRLNEMGNIHLHVDLIAGLPFEDRQNLIKSFNDIISLNADHFQVGFLKVLPGTEMQEKTEEFKLVYQQHPPYQVLKTKWLSLEDLFEFQQIEKLVNSIYNSENFCTTYSQLITEFSSPFQFFRTLLKFCIDQNFDLNKRDWQNVAENILTFVTNELSASINFSTDCLQWDWCQIASGHHYPIFLNSGKIKEWKVVGQELLKTWNNENEPFQSSQLKRTIYFKPSSKKLINKLKLKNSIYAFVPVQNKKEIIELVT
ncbi:MAG: DUF4080 domain-containing protein [Candidatus Cloacimonetes bacterium]|nr:DUF4080 domain-containing protein [Candidatus Cloacimonadota bacterium]MCF7882512.1 DUF4080 domain-containing protein [Candidatus Cloacimonadota bacterium]